MSLKNRIALITGVSRRKGIGFAIAQRLAQAGAKLFVQSWSPFDAAMPWGADEIDSMLADLRELTAVEYLSADFFLPETPQQVVDAARSAFAHVDMLIANHAYSLDSHLHELTAEHIDKHLLVNVRGTLLLAKAFAAQHDGREGGWSISQSLAICLKVSGDGKFETDLLNLRVNTSDADFLVLH